MTAPCRLSLKRVYEAARTVDSVFLHTPQFVFEPLREALGVRTTLKIETLNPARSFKGRGADFLVSALKDMQPTPQLGYASAGNFGQARRSPTRPANTPCPHGLRRRKRQRAQGRADAPSWSDGTPRERISTTPNSLLGFPSVGEKPKFDGR